MANFRDMMRNFLYEEVDDEEEYEEEASAAGFTVTTESVNPAAAAAAANPTAVNVMPGNPAEMDLAAQQAALEAAAMQQRQLQEQMAKLQAQREASQAAQAASMQQLAGSGSSQGTKTFGLSMDQVGRPDHKEESKPYRYDRRKLQTVRQKPAQIEYQAVLSPIFGNLDDDQKSFDSVHDAINLSKPDQLSEINSIISPMYGSAALTRARQEQEQSVPEYKPKRKKAAPSKEEKQGPRDLADYLVKEPIVIPRPVQKEDE